MISVTQALNVLAQRVYAFKLRHDGCGNTRSEGIDAASACASRAMSGWANAVMRASVNALAREVVVDALRRREELRVGLATELTFAFAGEYSRKEGLAGEEKDACGHIMNACRDGAARGSIDGAP